MGNLRKVLAVVFAAVMILSMSVTAFAAQTGSIEISNATVGKVYNAYKIFDATVSANDDIAYSIKSSDPWYDLVSDEESPFLLQQVGTTTSYNVLLKEDITNADVISWLKEQTAPAPASFTTTASSTTVTWEEVPYGYYFITSNLGAVVTVSNVKGDASVIDKNQSPSWDPEDPENPDDGTDTGKFVSSDGESYSKENTSGIDETVYFKINAFVPKYNKDNTVTEYTFVDTLSDGLTYNDDMVLYINGEEVPEDLYTIEADGQVITIILTVDDADDFVYPTDAHLSMEYTAELDEDAVFDNENTVSMSWEQTPNGDNEPEEPEFPDDSETDTYTYGFDLQKYKGSVSEENKLEGAAFKLYDALTGGNEIAVVKISNGNYRVAVTGEEGVVIEAGTARIFGLDLGTYYLEEVSAPNGFNMLTERQIVEIEEENTEDGYLTNEVAVINNSGSLLPSTGGMGTTIFYIAGGVLMVVAIVLLVTKRRANAKR